jgi:hypothetical protein
MNCLDASARGGGGSVNAVVINLADIAKLGVVHAVRRHQVRATATLPPAPGIQWPAAYYLPVTDDSTPPEPDT